MNVIDTLKKRNFIDSVSGEDSSELKELTKQPIVVYGGFDPTATSLHLGNLVTIICLKWFQKHGHTPIALIGGATGMIGDPSGKSIERPILSEEQIEKNIAGIRQNLETVLDFNHPTAPAQIINNYDWFKEFSYIDFLREVGRNFRVGPMLAKESVRSRMAGEGLSYTEFSYQVLQAYDFWHLFKKHNVKLQVGGSDQWGNITAGTELVRRLSGDKVYGLTFPLLTRSDGKKFGKSEGGAIWLAAEMLSPYEFYQYLFRTPDSDIILLMRMLTFMDSDEIEKYSKNLEAAPNDAQKRLAEEVTILVHGKRGLETALKVTQAASPGSETKLDAATLEAVAKDMPSYECSLEEVLDQKLIDLFNTTKLTNSKGESRRLIKNGGAYLNNKKITDEHYVIATQDIVEGRLLLLSAGKKKKMLVRISNKK
jgi:tyrosyl-tRNA synthetase